jgi:hypothetical protein
VKLRAIPVLLAIVLAVAGVFAFAPHSRSAETPDPNRYDQGWDQATTLQFYHTSQGGVVLPSAFMRALRMKNGQHFLDPAHMATLGFLPGAPGQPYPLGMTDSTSKLTGNIPMAGFTCAACHTGQLQYRGTTVRIDGGNANVDLQKFLIEVRLDLYRMAANPAERKAFLAEAVADGYPKDKASAGLDAEVARDKYVDEAAGKLKGGIGTPGGPGRVDALTGVAFNVFTLGLFEPSNVRRGLAPTNFPPLWDIWRFDWVQYNAFAKQPMARNVGEVIGLGGRLNIVDPVTHKLNPESTRWESTVNVRNLFWMENQLARLQPPPWPAAFGAIDQRKAVQGRMLFDQNCERCHGVRKIAGTDEWSVRVIPLNVIGTDPNSTIAFAGTQYNSGALGLGTVGFQAVFMAVKNLKEQAYRDAGIPKSEWGMYDGWNRPFPVVAPCGIKARPLVGIWSTPPFLHNGTVPSVYDMLSDTRPAHPIIGNPEFDPHKLGVVQEATATTLTVDTTLQGNSNAGHWFTDDKTRKGRIGPKLTEEQKYALIEYLKSATYANYPATTVAKPDPLPCADKPDWALGIRYDPEN